MREGRRSGTCRSSVPAEWKDGSQVVNISEKRDRVATDVVVMLWPLVNPPPILHFDHVVAGILGRMAGRRSEGHVW